MSDHPEIIFDGKFIKSLRGNKNHLDPLRPYAWLVEKERTVSGEIEDTAIIFLTNPECPFYCLMCDLWKNTTDGPAMLGAIPTQIEWALEQMPDVKHVKLYNSGSFFDDRAIPPDDYEKIASLLRGFETVIVESHPKFIGDNCLNFKNMLKPELHVALGLETIHQDVLLKLNKQMTLEDFSHSVRFLTQNGIRSRAFVLLRPPFMSEKEGIYWAKKSIVYAFNAGVECCTIIPVRAGNGAMELLKERGDFCLPDIQSLETVLEFGIELNAGRVFADVWDLSLFSSCNKCLEKRAERLIDINLRQAIVDNYKCSCIIQNYML
jgi:radical SAM enzyme (TIGR01210 family)